MLPDLSGLWEKLEARREEMLALIDGLSSEELLFKLRPDRWNILQVLQHVVMGESSITSAVLLTWE